MANIQTALRRTLDDSPSAANVRTLARVTFFDGSNIEARTAAEALTEISPEPSSYLLLGAVEFRMGHADKTLAAFQAALQRTHDRDEAATAKLGMAEAYKSLGQADNADHMMGEAMASLPEAALITPPASPALRLRRSSSGPSAKPMRRRAIRVRPWIFWALRA